MEEVNLQEELRLSSGNVDEAWQAFKKKFEYYTAMIIITIDTCITCYTGLAVISQTCSTARPVMPEDHGKKNPKSKSRGYPP